MPKDAAKSLLEDVWGRERGIPIDPVWIARKLGLDVIETELPDDVSGALIKDADRDPVIVLRADDSKPRQRFTCAHELGHYIDRKKQCNEQYEFVDLRGKMASKGTDQAEIFANNFAANLLMPEDYVRAMAKTGLTTFALAVRFGVSDEAMRLRLKNLRLLQQNGG